MSNLVLVRDEKFQDHLTPQMHPESPKRLAAIDQALKDSNLAGKLSEAHPRAASEDDLICVHKESYIESLHAHTEAAKTAARPVPLDAETWMCAETYDIAKLAAGAGLVALDQLQNENFTSSFVVARPPGHHALASSAMGFCLFNNIAVAARYAQRKLGFKRILIIDWDVHHGNGTQDLFFDDPSVCFISFHQFPFWPPNSGWYTDDGTGDGKGYNVNIPLPAGTGDRGYLAAWDALVKPVCLEYKPDLILVSAGYDGHESDPLGDQKISTPGYALLTEQLCELVKASKTKVACFLEGGYNTKSLSDSVLTTMQVLNADDKANVQLSFVKEAPSLAELKPATADRSPQQVDERIAEVKRHYSQYWKSLR